MTKPIVPHENSVIQEDEIDLKQLFSALMENKLTIFLTMITLVSIAWLYLYMKPVSYETYTTVDVKTQKNTPVMPNMELFEGLGGLSNDEVDKQMILYKTFSVNKEVLDVLSWDVQYFREEGLKKIELYNNNPVEIIDMKITNRDFLNKKFMIYPHNEEEFTLKIVEHSLFSRLFRPILDLPVFKNTSFNEPIFEKNYTYGTLVETKDFKFRALKVSDFTKPFIVQFNGSKRDIYENIIKNNLTISRVDPKSSLIRIAYRGNIPERSEEYINTLSKMFSALNVAEKSEKNRKILASIDKQLEEISGLMAKSEMTIEAYKVSENIVKPSEQSASLIEKLSKIDFELTQAELKYSMLINLTNAKNYSRNLGSLSLSLSELGEKKIASLFDALQMAQLKRSELQIDFKKDFPELRKIEIKIANIKRKIKSSISSLRNTLAGKIDGLKIEKQKSEDFLKTLPAKERKLVNYNRNYDVNSKMYTYLLQLKSEKTIAQSAILSDFKIIDKAYTDSKTAKPKKLLVLLVAGITGLLLGIFLALMKEFFDDRLKDLHAIESETTLSVFGFIPQLKKKVVKLEVLENKNSSFTESFREIRNNIRAGYGANDSNIILVTSTVSGEGKTVTSINVASILSLTNKKCIIINMDLRKPMMHKYFSMSNKLGLTSYLTGKESLESVITKTKHKNLDVISAGPAVSNPSELLLKPELKEMLAYLRVHYDYIIVDSAPVGLVADSLELLKMADLTLFVLRDGVSKKGYIKNLNRMIRINHIDNVSLVVNGVQEHKSGYGSYGGYGYGYGSYGKDTAKIKETVYE